MADEYIYDDKTGEFKKRPSSTSSNSNNRPPSNNNDEGCLGCIGWIISLIAENWWWVLLVFFIVGMCTD